MTVEVPVSSLELGMYIVHYGDAQASRIRWDRPIRFLWEIDVIRQSGATVATIDPSMGTAPANSPDVRPSEQPDILESESFLLADRVYSRVVDFMHDALSDIARKKSFDADAAAEHVDDIVNGVERDERAATCLTLIRREGYLATHSVNVCILSTTFAAFAGHDRETVHNVARAALFHDIGKMLIDPTILEKPGRLGWKEFNVIRQHPGLGKLLLHGKDIPEAVGRAVLQHHERADGSGYPHAIKDGHISPEARIIALADVYDAMVGERPYKASVTPDMALRALYRQRNQAFRADDVERFIKFMGVYPVGSVVKLEDGSRAMVVALDRVRPLEPTVKLMYDANMRPVDNTIVSTGKDCACVSGSCARTFDRRILKRVICS